MLEVVSYILIIYLTFASIPYFSTANDVDQMNCDNENMGDFMRFGILLSHNDLRSNLSRGIYDFPSGSNMYRIRYDCQLEKLAQQRANNECSISNISDHLANTIGENIYRYRSNNSNSDSSNDWMSMALGNWTTAKNIPLFLAQILAGKTLLIGCAKSSCPMTNEGQETIVVCEYWPKVSKGPLYSQGKFCENGNDCTLYAKSTCNTETRLCDTGDDIELNEFLQPIYSPKNITESTNLDFTPYQLPDDDMITNSSHEDEEKYIGFKHDLHRLRFLNAHKERRNQILKGITTLDAMNSEQIEFFFQLTWSDELEKKAFSDAEKCESLEPKSSRKYHRIIMDSFDFDNLTYILDREFSMTVQKWWSNPMDESDENIGLFLATELGCGFASCVDDNLRMAIDIVCHYWPTSDPSELYDYAIGCERDGDCASLINSHCNIEEKICVKNNL